MNKSHKTQIALLVLFGGVPVAAYSPDAETVLETLRERMAAGLAGQAGYDAFLADLDDADGCESWAEDPPDRDADVWSAVQSVCPELADPGPRNDSAGNSAATGGGGWRSRAFASQTVQPRRAGPAGPFFQVGSGSASGRLFLSSRDLRPYDRRAESRKEGFTLEAGHLHPDMEATRLGFVAGSRFYAGWSGSSGFSGPFASPEASLEGLGLAYHGGGWRAQAVGTWNRLDPRGVRIAPDRRDALLYAVGVARRNLHFQAAHQRFEPAVGPAFSVTVGGAEASDPEGRWRLGLAASRLDPGNGPSSSGGYGEIAWGSPPRHGRLPETPEQGGYLLEGHQASREWANPLQSPRGYRRDTLEGQWILPGRGEGGLSLRSRLPLLERAGYRADWNGGGEAAWVLGSEGLLGTRARLALIQSLACWTWEVGTGLRYRRTPLTGATAAETAADEAGEFSGFGSILRWRCDGWKARWSLTEKAGGYRGPYPEPMALSFERRTGRGGYASGEAFTGDIRNPAGYLRLALGQEWDLGGGMVLKHALRLPWTRTTGWAGDMGYRLGLEASF